MGNHGVNTAFHGYIKHTENLKTYIIKLDQIISFLWSKPPGSLQLFMKRLKQIWQTCMFEP